MEAELKSRVAKYRSKVGSLLYLAKPVRPDIAAEVSMCAQFSVSPDAAADARVDRIMRYIAGSVDRGLRFRRGALEVQVYTDADGQMDVSRRPRYGYVVLVGGTPCLWTSSLAHIVTMSTGESELVAVAETVKMLLWYCDILEFVGIAVRKPQVVYSDNQSAVFMAADSSAFRRAKHFDIRYLFVLQHCGEGGRFRVEYVNTAQNRADVLTKSMPLAVFRKFIPWYLG